MFASRKALYETDAETLPLIRKCPAATLPPHLDVPSPYQKLPGFSAAEPHVIAPKPTETVGGKDDWTVVINLSVTQMTASGQVLGAKHKAQELKTLAGQTEKSGVKIVVQETERQPDVQSGGSKYVLHRYELANGQIHELPAVPSEGTDKDLAHILQLAVDENKSARIALINQSHGDGSRGIIGDSGPCGLPLLERAIKDGLQNKLGEKKLDLLDVDACLTDNSLTSVMQGVAKDQVCSEELESAAGPGADTQHITEWLPDLLHNPSMSGRALGEDIVKREAEFSKRTVVSPDPPSSIYENKPINTLANYDLNKYADFSKAVNELGDQLFDAAKNPANKKAIEETIEKTPRLAGEIDPNEDRQLETRDLSYVCKQLREAIQKGDLKNDGGKLTQALEQVEKARKELVTSSFGIDDIPHYNEFGGISIFLPSQKYADIKSIAEKEDYFDALKKAAQNGHDQPAFVRLINIKMLTNVIGQDLPPQHEAELANLTNIVTRLTQCTDNIQEFEKVCQSICTEVDRLHSSKAHGDHIQTIMKWLNHCNQLELDRHRTTDGPGWYHLLNFLVGTPAQ